MPARNGMGPEGLGPLTGRGMGECGGRVGAGFVGRGRGYGMGFGAGRGFGRGMGRGFGRGMGWGAPVGFVGTVSDAEARDVLLARKAAIDSALAELDTKGGAKNDGGKSE